MSSITATGTTCADDIPMPIVTLNRLVLVGGVLAAVALGQPLVTTALFLVVLGAALCGRSGSLIYQVGSRALAEPNARALAADNVEDRRVMRFNNAIAAALLGAAQLAFLAGVPFLGWVLAVAVAMAAAVALAGFCFGCVLYTRFRMHGARANRHLRA